MHELQAAAAVGQMGLCQAYEAAFAEYGLRTAPILLPHEDLADRHRYLNARSTLFALLRLGVVPIVNENDTVVTDEIRLGDNDTAACTTPIPARTPKPSSCRMRKPATRPWKPWPAAPAAASAPAAC
ncbi:hypothetical protein G6F31_019553 [Rhizopus arrhizus]|nr:hypothetical protein G6F31_019553 [Rhizopus arrhizus]